MHLDPQKTALLTLDLQYGILDYVPGSEAILSNASKAVAFARDKQFRIIHIGLGFSEGHPEIPDHSPLAMVKKNNLFVKGTPSADFCDSIIHPKDLVIYKQRYSAFSENQLHLVLRSLAIQNLVFFGISTSGITLSTLRQAFDLDFRCMVIADSCFDRDPEVHRILTEKVFPAQASVVTTHAFITEHRGC